VDDVENAKGQFRDLTRPVGALGEKRLAIVKERCVVDREKERGRERERAVL